MVFAMALHTSVCSAVPAKVTAAWAVACICSGWGSMATVTWTGQHPHLYWNAMQYPQTVMDANYQCDVNSTPVQLAPERDEGCWCPTVKGTMLTQVNSGDKTNYELGGRGCGVLSSPSDPGAPPEARREQYHQQDLPYLIPRLPEQDLERDDTTFMQATTPATGWFTKAERGFARLVRQGDGRRAALTLRDRLRRNRHDGLHVAVQAHLPAILAAEPQEGDAQSSEPVEVDTWVQFVLVELARVAGLSRADQEALTGAGEELEAVSMTECSESISPGSTPYGIFHAAYVWRDGSWSTRDDLRQAGRHDLLPPPSREAEADDGDPDSAPLTEELDGVSMFQLGSRDTTWEDLMEQMWTWFEGGLQVELALAMLRRRTEERRDRDYLRWVQGPLHTVGAGVASCNRASTETTPPIFYRWSQRVEAHLFAGTSGNLWTQGMKAV